MLPSETRPIGQWFPVKVHHAAAEVPGRIVVLRDAPLAPGEEDFVQLVLERPIAAAAGDSVAAARNSASRASAPACPPVACLSIISVRKPSDAP